MRTSLNYDALMIIQPRVLGLFERLLKRNVEADGLESGTRSMCTCKLRREP